MIIKHLKTRTVAKPKLPFRGSVSLLGALMLLMLSYSCGMKTAQEVGLNFSTQESKLPGNLLWQEIGFAKELMNQKEMVVVISGGTNPIPLAEWDRFKAAFPYRKNIDRKLLFQKSAFYRSPDTAADCEGAECITERTYKGYSWVELAKPICVDFVPRKTDMVMPEAGHLAIKTIQKCQAVMFTDSIYQLTDNKGNYYVMHAFEKDRPDTTAILPAGWRLRKVAIAEPLFLVPFGGGNECYYNIVGDHLGQGYHQYIFAGERYVGYE
jgi:hypothetical protein